MKKEDKENIIRFVDHLRIKYELEDETIKVLYELITLYFNKYHSIKYLDNFLRNDLILNFSKRYIISFDVFLDFIRFILNVNGECNCSTNEVANYLYNVYTIINHTDKKPLYFYTDFDVFNYICELINTREFDFSLLEPYFFECNIYLRSFIMALYCNLSLVIGYEFNINNYDYKAVTDKLYEACKSFLSKENLANIKTHIVLNCEDERISLKETYIAGFYYAKNYIKNKYGCKEVIR